MQELEIKHNLLLSNNPLYIVDAGAMNGMHFRWDKFTSSYKGILFEPDPREYKLLKSKGGKHLIILNLALSDSTSELDFHLLRSRGASSVYWPNIEFLNKFSNVERFDVVKSIKVQADTLNNQLKKYNIFDIDFMKIDTRGHGLPVLRGSIDYLENLVGLEIELEFAPQYKNQPLFNDVDNFIKEYGFELFDLQKGYWKRKEISNHHPHYQDHPSNFKIKQKGQLIFGNALYFKSPEQVLLIDRLTQEKIVRSIYVYLIYGYFDLAQILFLNACRNNLLTKEIKDEVLLVFSKNYRKWFYSSQTWY